MNSHTITLIPYKTHTNSVQKYIENKGEKDMTHRKMTQHTRLPLRHTTVTFSLQHTMSLTASERKTQTHTLAQYSLAYTYIYKYQIYGEVHTQQHPLPIPTVQSLLNGPLKTHPEIASNERINPKAIHLHEHTITMDKNCHF